MTMHRDGTGGLKAKAETRVAQQARNPHLLRRLYRNMIDYIDDTERYAIRRGEQSGDTLLGILNTGEFYPLIDSERPRALLFDGGGNDLIDGNNGWPAKLFAAPLGPDLINVANWS